MTAEEMYNEWLLNPDDTSNVIELMERYGLQKQNEVLDKVEGGGFEMYAIYDKNGVRKDNCIATTMFNAKLLAVREFDMLWAELEQQGYTCRPLTLINKQSILNLKNKL